MPSYTVEVELVRKVEVTFNIPEGEANVDAIPESDVVAKAVSQLTDKDRRDATRTRVTEVKTEVGEWQAIQSS